MNNFGEYRRYIMSLNDWAKNEIDIACNKDILDKAAKKGYLNGFEFSILIQNLLISENGYIIDTGNWENVNAKTALYLVENIKKHPILWKLFFMIA